MAAKLFVCIHSALFLVSNMVRHNLPVERKHGPKPALDHGPGTAFPGPNLSICFMYNFFELLDHCNLNQKSQVWTIVIRTRKAMVISTRKAEFGPWSIGPEKSGIDHGHSDQKSQIWTMVTIRPESQVWTMVI
jgi:hypothetical protein